MILEPRVRISKKLKERDHERETPFVPTISLLRDRNTWVRGKSILFVSSSLFLLSSCETNMPEIVATLCERANFKAYECMILNARFRIMQSFAWWLCSGMRKTTTLARTTHYLFPSLKSIIFSYNCHMLPKLFVNLISIVTVPMTCSTVQGLRFWFTSHPRNRSDWDWDLSS